MVTNRHSFACKLVVRDGVPVSEDEKRVSVVLRHPEGLAEMGQEEGLLGCRTFHIHLARVLMDIVACILNVFVSYASCSGAYGV